MLAIALTLIVGSSLGEKARLSAAPGRPTMTKVGRFVTDPRAGAYCYVTLDSGERILVRHDRGGFKGGSVSIHEVRWWGLASGDVLFRCDLERNDGRQILAHLTQGAPPTSARATPLGAFVEYVKGSRTTSDVKERCTALGSLDSPPAA
jgi:hypothetical protein